MLVCWVDRRLMVVREVNANVNEHIHSNKKKK
jgi:hypothetical protein